MAIQDKIDGYSFWKMIQAGAACLEEHSESINALNVFPVPDGDTGINMTLTLRAALNPEIQVSSNVGEVAQAVSRASMLGARGNSGVILSQFFKGFAIGLENIEQCTAVDLILALKTASEAGYEAVGNPVEGTILTVMRAAAAGADKGDQSISAVLNLALESAETALEYTPSQLPVLAEAGVVDAGGQGFVALLAGFSSYIDGTVPTLKIGSPAEINSHHIFTQSDLGHTEDELFGFCTQFLILGSELRLSEIKEAVSSVADSTVVIGDDQVVRIHAHASDPGPLLSLGLSYGNLDQINIMNMDLQHQEFISKNYKPLLNHSDQAIVAVVPSLQFDILFRDQGAALTVLGGQSINPSAEEILNGIKDANSDHVLILPNNPNVKLSAIQASEMAECACTVVPTESVPHGIAALLAYNSNLEPSHNANAMQESANGIVTGEVTVAARDAKVGGINIEEGQIIGMLEGSLVSCNDSVPEVLIDLISKTNVEAGDLITLYYGADLKEDKATAHAELVRSKFDGVDVEIYEGGQPYYHYFVAIE